MTLISKHSHNLFYETRPTNLAYAVLL